ncbi:endonuclease domain-containing protein [Bacillus salitolerans]|uniref:Endonuclease domain-containing protein n=1 Tax=Bacillus salitolerans TaxID=1437434 RepID=A0ABW4LNW3_9BACI
MRVINKSVYENNIKTLDRTEINKKVRTYILEIGTPFSNEAVEITLFSANQLEAFLEIFPSGSIRVKETSDFKFFSLQELEEIINYEVIDERIGWEFIECKHTYGSELEKILGLELNSIGIIFFTQVIPCPKRGFKNDFSIFTSDNRKINIEVDGYWHIYRKNKDKERDDYLQSLDWTVLRFDEYQINFKMEKVINTIVSVVYCLNEKLEVSEDQTILELKPVENKYTNISFEDNEEHTQFEQKPIEKMDINHTPSEQRPVKKMYTNISFGD